MREIMEPRKSLHLKTVILSVFLLATLFIPQFIQSVRAISALTTEATSIPTIATDYFRKQLETSNQQIFYEAMRTMLKNGYFKRGDVSIEVIGLDMTVDKQTLLDDMGAARDAFMLDYPDLF